MEGPKAVILTRQGVPFIEETCKDKALRGAYYLIENPNPDAIIFATGSEVQIGREVVNMCNDLKLSLVSFFSWELFELQDEKYRESILKKVPKISIEALSTFGWSRYSDYQIGMNHFGNSAKAKDIFEFEGFTPTAVAMKIREFLNK
jgi:transketolase